MALQEVSGDTFCITGHGKCHLLTATGIFASQLPTSVCTTTFLKQNPLTQRGVKKKKCICISSFNKHNTNNLSSFFAVNMNFSSSLLQITQYVPLGQRFLYSWTALTNQQYLILYRAVDCDLNAKRPNRRRELYFLDPTANRTSIPRPASPSWSLY